MTYALVLAAKADAMYGQLAALGVRGVAAAERTGPGLLTVAAAARAAGERVLICVGDDDAVPEEVLARLLETGGTVAVTGMQARIARAAPSHPAERPPRAWADGGALVVDTPDLDALAAAAESLAATQAAPAEVGALIDELARREVTVRVLDAGPDGDGAVAQLIIDPAARDIAWWAAGRELTPAALYGISLGLGLVSAVWFSELAIRSKALAIVALFASFTVGRAGAQLAATGRKGRIRAAAVWFGAASGLLTEIAVYAALTVSAGLVSQNAAGGLGYPAGLNGIFGGTLRDSVVASWVGAGQAGVWRLAVAALLMLGVRWMAELCYEGTMRAPGKIFPRSAKRILEQVITLPTGERFVVIAVTAVFFGPRVTFLVLLAWGVVAAGYAWAAHLARSAGTAHADGGLPAGYRGDGVLASWLGGLARGMLPPLPPLLVGLLVTCVLAALGLANLPGALVLAPAVAMLPAALGARHPHHGRLDWLVPPLLLVSEGVYLAALGFSHRVSPPLIFALLAAVIMRHADLAYRAMFGMGLSADARGFGWEGRMLLAGLAAVIGVVPLAYAVISGYLWLLFCWDFLSGWLKFANLGPMDGGRG
jgi:Family of unknown function (DUF5941)